jgi:hypothetical protein
MTERKGPPFTGPRSTPLTFDGVRDPVPTGPRGRGGRGYTLPGGRGGRGYTSPSHRRLAGRESRKEREDELAR